MTRKLIITSCFLLCVFSCFSQNRTKKQKEYATIGSSSIQYFAKKKSLNKNVIYVNGGIIPLWEAYNINYERMVVNLKGDFVNSLWVRAGAGGWGLHTEKGGHVLTTFMMLLGSKNSHVELSAGVTLLEEALSGSSNNDLLFQNSNSYSSDENPLYPAGGVSYRYQKPEGHFIFRTGVTFPEHLHFSFGYAF
ncbi:MAG: hypothetical protein CMO01_20095 [Thalassobius sp.]|nr:hypothetical protein [Thalassovita sp.]